MCLPWVYAAISGREGVKIMATWLSVIADITGIFALVYIILLTTYDAIDQKKLRKEELKMYRDWFDKK